MIDYNYINEVLAKFEGKAFTRGYIPCKGGTYFGGNDPLKGEPLGASGVTIATGVDLGQQKRSVLEGMGVSRETLLFLEPYIGLKKQLAVDALKKAPLTLAEKQVAEIDAAVHKTYIDNTAQRFGSGFATAPKQVQAVAVSLCYQFGNPQRDTSPSLGYAWMSMQRGDYRSAVVALTNKTGWSVEHQQYLPRRKREADLLLEII